MIKILTVLLIAFILIGCDDLDINSISCEKNEDCVNGYYCYQKSCIKKIDCEDDNGCSEVEYCYNQYCQPVDKICEDKNCGDENGFCSFNINDRIPECSCKGNRKFSNDLENCICKTGYIGDNCEDCDQNYQDNNEDGSCNPSCEISCLGDHRNCEDSSGDPICGCEENYQDNDENGTCIESCSLVCTGENETCDDSLGVVDCVCYDGYQDNDNNLSCSIACDSENPCGGYGECDDSTGTAICSCSDGYQDNDNDLICKESCQIATCQTPFVCDDSSGTHICDFNQLLIKGEGDKKVTDMEVDRDGNIYIAGWFTKEIDTDPTDNGENIHVAEGGRDGFLIKISQDGSTWSYIINGAGEDEISDIALTDDQNIYIIGTYTGEVDFDPSEDGVVIETSKGGKDAFLLKLDPSKNYLKHYTWGDQYDDYGYKVVVTEANDVIVLGSFKGTIKLNPSEECKEEESTDTCPQEVSQIEGELHYSNGFFLSLSDEGGYNWGKKYTYGDYEGAGDTVTGSLSVKGSTLLIVISSYKVETNKRYYFSIRYNVDGTPLFNLIALDGDTQGNEVNIPNAHSDELGDIYLASSFKGTIEFNFIYAAFGIGESDIKTSEDNTKDIFISKVESIAYAGTTVIGGKGDDIAESFLLNQEDGTIFITGSFEKTVDFDITDEEDIKIASENSKDLFLMKIGRSLDYYWTYHLTGPGNITGKELKYKDNALYIAGEFKGIMRVCETGDNCLIESTFENNQYSTDIMILKIEDH